MKHLLLIAFTQLSLILYSQQPKGKNLRSPMPDINWAKSTNWKIYSLPGKKAANFPIDTLKNFKSKSLEQDSMRLYLANVRPIESTYGAVWQGYIVGTCEIDHAIRKIIFSTYGGFFFDPASSRYFELPEDLGLRAAWHAYLNRALMSADPHASIP